MTDWHVMTHVNKAKTKNHLIIFENLAYPAHNAFILPVHTWPELKASNICPFLNQLLGQK